MRPQAVQHGAAVRGRFRLVVAVAVALDVVLADQHVVLLEALTAVLSQVGHRVIGTATTCVALVDDIRRTQPDICVTENALPDCSVVEAIGELSSISPRTKFVILTADGDADALRRALDAGAAGYVHKSRGLAVLLDVLHRVAKEEIVVEGSFRRPRSDEGDAPPQLLRRATYLTHRELDCLTLLAEGLDTAAMARRLGVSRTTVRTHVQAVLNKLGAHSRLEAASLATRFGLVERPLVHWRDVNGDGG